MLLEDKLIKISLAFSVWLGALMGAAVYGFFTYWLVVVTTGCLFIFILHEVFKKYKDLARLDRKDLIVLLFLLLFSVFTGYFHHDLPTSRDDLGYIMAATQLTEHGSLSFEDNLFQAGYSLISVKNNLVTSQFLPGYVTLSAAFNMLGGLAALFWANSVLVFLFMTAFYFIGKYLFNYKVGILALAFLATSFFFNWFPRRTNSENLSLSLIFLGAFILIYALKYKRYKYLWLSMIPLAVNLLVRIESLIFFPIFVSIILVIIIQVKLKDKVVFKNKLPSFLFVFYSIILLISYCFIHNPDYLLSHFEKIIGFKQIILILIFLGVGILFLYWLKRKKILLARINFRPLRIFLFIGLVVLVMAYVFFLQGHKSLAWGYVDTYYTLLIMTQYVIAPFMLLAVLLLARDKISKYLAILFLILLPAFYPFIQSYIALDLPWFLRRFYLFIPFCFLTAAYFLVKSDIFTKKIRLIIIGTLILINLCLTAPILFFVEHDNLAQQITTHTEKLSTQDILIVEPGQRWSKIGIMMHYIYDQKVVVGLDGFDQAKIDALVANYDNVYILSSDSYDLITDNQDNVVFQETWNLSYPRLERKSKLTGYIKQNPVIISVSRISEVANTALSQEIFNVEVQLNLYKLDNKKALRPTDGSHL